MKPDWVLYRCNECGKMQVQGLSGGSLDDCCDAGENRTFSYVQVAQLASWRSVNDITGWRAA